MKKRIYKIAIFGAASEKLDKNIYKIAEATGAEIAKHGHTLITGAAAGISRYGARGAKKSGGLVIGISPTTNNEEKDQFNVNFDNIDVVVHTGFGYKGRNVLSVRSCDAIIVINGRFGTLSEIANAEGENKPIVVISNTGGCATIIEDIFKTLSPDYKLFALANSPKEAVALIENMLKSRP